VNRRCFLAVALAAIVLCLAASASLAATTNNGAYGGKTAQGFRLRARVEGGRITLIRVKVKLRCHDGGLLYDDLSDFEPSPMRSDGSFTDVQFGPSDEVSWTGHVRKDRLKGSLRVTDKVEGGVKCDSGTVTFSAAGVAPGG
jgi:hypothetical protein